MIVYMFLFLRINRKNTEKLDRGKAVRVGIYAL